LHACALDASVRSSDNSPELGDLAGPSCLDPRLDRRDLAAFGAALPLEGAGLLFRHWLERWQDGAPPPRGAVLPEDLGRLLPHTFLIEVEADSGRLRYRLIGGEIVAAFGYDSTGRYLDTVSAGFSAEVRHRWERRDRLCVAQARPVYGSWNLAHVGRAWRVLASLRLPLTEGGRVTHLLGYGTVT
jgi:hypothetical protein